MDQAVKTEIDAITLLTQDHKQVKKMFQEYASLGDRAYVAKQKLAMRICAELTVHTTIEEEIFYPAARAAIDDDDIMDEADVEHAGAKELITQIRCMTSTESHFDAKVKVLGEEIDHHVKEEQTEMFPKVKKSGLDTKAIGARLSARKDALKQQMEAA
jgi:hemerythrin superfamily protein